MSGRYWYIGERINPQLSKSYYKAYGKITTKEAKRKENCLYGMMIVRKYNSQEEYDAEINRLKQEGFNVH